MDLWPEDIAIVEEKAPVAILREQASIIGKRTKGLVEGEVKAVQFDISYGYKQSDITTSKTIEIDYEGSGIVPPDLFSFAFYLRAPALQNYAFRAFIVRYNIDMYPVRILLDADISNELQQKAQVRITAKEKGGYVFVASSEEAYTEFLSLIFNSVKIRRVIGAILAQSQDVEFDVNGH